MRSDIIERLNKIAYSGIDPKRSQIHNYIPNWLGGCDTLFNYGTPPFYPEKFQTMYYDEMCKSIIESEDKVDSGEIIEEDIAIMLNVMEDDIEKGYLGFVYDW